jgi:hypothetical protein
MVEYPKDVEHLTAEQRAALVAASRKARPNAEQRREMAAIKQAAKAAAIAGVLLATTTFVSAKERPAEACKPCDGFTGLATTEYRAPSETLAACRVAFKNWHAAEAKLPNHQYTRDLADKMFALCAKETLDDVTK